MAFHFVPFFSVAVFAFSVSSGLGPAADARAPAEGPNSRRSLSQFPYFFGYEAIFLHILHTAERQTQRYNHIICD